MASRLTSNLFALLLVALLAAGPAWSTSHELPADGWVFGEDLYIDAAYQDALLDIARRHSIGYEEIQRANPRVDLWIPGEGTKILVPGRRILPPGSHEGIVVNLPEHRLYYFPKPKRNEKPVVITYPVSIGKMDSGTPLAQTQIVAKEKNPYWYPPESIRKEHAARGEPLPQKVPPGRDNPLGQYKMRLGIEDGTYLIHGTNNPLAVGMAVTHGCIRMYPEDIAELFAKVPVGTKVRLINEPVKIAHFNGELLLEVHPQVDAQGQSMEPDLAILSERLVQVLGDSPTAVHWDYARETLQLANGIPTLVGLDADLQLAMDASVNEGDFASTDADK